MLSVEPKLFLVCTTFLLFGHIVGQAPASGLHNHFFIVNKYEDENIINQFVGIIKWFDQSGDRVSKNNKVYHICCMLSFNIVLLKV